MEARRALAEAGSVAKQLADIEQKLGEQNAALRSILADAQREISEILKTKEASAQAGGLRVALTNLAAALRVVESGDRAVPSQAIEVYKESSQGVKAGIAAWTSFKQTKLPQLNRKLTEGGFAPIEISEIEQEVEYLMSR